MNVPDEAVQAAVSAWAATSATSIPGGMTDVLTAALPHLLLASADALDERLAQQDLQGRNLRAWWSISELRRMAEPEGAG